MAYPTKLSWTLMLLEQQLSLNFLYTHKNIDLINEV